MKVEYTVVQAKTRIIKGDLVVYHDKERHTGEVVGFISGNKNEPDRLVIADDDTKCFVKVDMNDCKVIDNANSKG